MLRSVNNMVIAPANTGRDRRRRMAVIITLHGKRGVLSDFCRRNREFIMVVIKFAAPRIELIPAKWREKIAMSTDGPLWKVIWERGGYTVQPVPAPSSTRALDSNSVREGMRIHNLMLFMRGNVISGAVIIRGVSQFPNPPIIAGITRKKIMTNA